MFSRTLPPTFLFLQYSIVKEQTPSRRGVGAWPLSPSDPVECRSRGSLEFDQPGCRRSFLGSELRGRQRRAALVVEAYIVATPSNCQRPFLTFANFLRQKPKPNPHPLKTLRKQKLNKTKPAQNQPPPQPIQPNPFNLNAKTKATTARQTRNQAKTTGIGRTRTGGHGRNRSANNDTGPIHGEFWPADCEHQTSSIRAPLYVRRVPGSIPRSLIV